MIDALIFDKDGTLFDFRASWGSWTMALVNTITDDPAKAEVLFHDLGFDPKRVDFHPDSIVIAHTTDEIAAFVAARCPDHPREKLLALMNQLASDAPLVPATDLRALFEKLRDMGMKLGLATNDTERPAHTHLAKAGVLDLFDFVAGSDSGFGAKPAPGQLLAFCSQLSLDPKRVAMVGDSLHDMDAGLRAGMQRIAVLTGIAMATDLADHCDILLETIGEIPAWLENRQGKHHT